MGCIQSSDDIAKAGGALISKIPSSKNVIASKDKETKLNFLKRLAFFSDYPDNKVGPLASAFKVRVIQPGEILVASGDKSDKFFFTCDTKVEVLSANDGYRLRIIDENSIFGEFGFMHNINRTVSVKAVAKGYVIEVTRDAYESVKTSFAMQRFNKWVDKISAETVLDCLGKVDFLSHLKRDELRALANVFTCRTIQAGERLYTEGEPADSFFVLVRGELLVHNTDSHGFVVELFRMTEGSTFGELAMLQDHKRTAHVTALAQGVLYSLSPKEFKHFLNESVSMRKEVEKTSKERAAIVNMTKRIPFLNVLPANKFEQLNTTLTIHRRAPGEFILKQGGSWPQKFFVITRGTVEVFVDDKKVRTMGPGDYFGEVSLLTGRKHTASVRVSQSMPCFCVEASSATFEALFVGEPAILAQIELKVLGAGASLEKILQFPKTRLLFEKHCSKEFAKENIDFWLGAVQVEALGKNVMDDKTLEVMGLDVTALKKKKSQLIADMSRALFKDYVSPDSNQQINLKAQTFETLQKAIFEGVFNVDMFKDAKDEIFGLMDRDNYMRFKATKEFKSLMSKMGTYVAEGEEGKPDHVRQGSKRLSLGKLGGDKV